MPKFGTRTRPLTPSVIRPESRLPRLAAEAQAFVLMTVAFGYRFDEAAGRCIMHRDITLTGSMRI
jgi:hypothetical protein